MFGSPQDLIKIPALITLAVTLLRLVGELLDWPSLFFNAEAGGGFAIVGIVWLAPIFGVCFPTGARNAAVGAGSGNFLDLNVSKTRLHGQRLAGGLSPG